MLPAPDLSPLLPAPPPSPRRRWRGAGWLALAVLLFAAQLAVIVWWVVGG